MPRCLRFLRAGLRRLWHAARLQGDSPPQGFCESCSEGPAELPASSSSSRSSPLLLFLLFNILLLLLLHRLRCKRAFFGDVLKTQPARPPARPPDFRAREHPVLNSLRLQKSTLYSTASFTRRAPGSQQPPSPREHPVLNSLRCKRAFLGDVLKTRPARPPARRISAQMGDRGRGRAQGCFSFFCGCLKRRVTSGQGPLDCPVL